MISSITVRSNAVASRAPSAARARLAQRVHSIMIRPCVVGLARARTEKSSSRIAAAGLTRFAREHHWVGTETRSHRPTIRLRESDRARGIVASPQQNQRDEGTGSPVPRQQLDPFRSLAAHGGAAS